MGFNSGFKGLICSHEFSDNLQAIWAGVHGPEEAGTWTVTAVEEDSRRKTYTPIKEEGRWRIRKNKEIKDILQWTDIVKCMKSLQLRCCGCMEMMDNERVPNQVTGVIEGVRK